MSPKNNSKDVKEEPEYTGDFGQKKKVVKHSKITATHKKIRHLKLMILVFFYVWKETRVWAH